MKSFEKLAAIRPGIELAAFAKNYKLAGGTREVWVQAYDNAPAAETQSQGQRRIVGNDPIGNAEALHPTPGGGHDRDVGNDHQISADARQPTAGGEDQSRCVGNDHDHGVFPAGAPIPDADHERDANNGQPPGVGAGNQIAREEAMVNVSKGTVTNLPPAREPSTEDRLAIFRDADHTFLETVRVRGKLLGNCQFGSLRSIRALNNYENLIIAALLEYRKDRPIKDETKVKDAIDEPTFRDIVNYARRSLQSAVAVA